MPGGERDALAGVSGAHRPDAVAPLVCAELSDGIVRAADLEGADRLERLELEIDIRGRTMRGGGWQFQADQGRANDQVVDRAGGRLNVVERYFTHTETSMLTRRPA